MTKFSFLGFVLAAITFGSGCISYSSTTRKAPATLAEAATHSRWSAGTDHCGCRCPRQKRGVTRSETMRHLRARMPAGPSSAGSLLAVPGLAVAGSTTQGDMWYGGVGHASRRPTSTGMIARPTSLDRMWFGISENWRRRGTGWPSSTAARTRSAARSVT